eukprot:comp17566_c0_seq1/m.17172 comp17566_c0_seq1/g.17172  ORF comp17566_c0_seq1/g.17172 comp17566_c0_seq1/m.17172 type:complete len:507 (-) comp17566_c0_seq1:493-2013(-)
MKFLFTTAALALSAQLACASHMFRKAYGKLRTLEEVVGIDMMAQNDNSSYMKPEERWFEHQLVDHFDHTNRNLWRQRYFIVDQYWGGNGFPIFLFISGEGEMTPGYLAGRSSQMVEYARQFNALAVGLEHRFFGKSQPTGDLKTESLRFLTSQQALADLAWFAEKYTEEVNAPKSKWVAFGGSYAGCLAAWVREKYPNIISGAVSSGGPVLAKLNFHEYLEQAERSIKYFGGEACTNAIANATKTMYSLAETEKGLYILKDKFRLCDIPRNELDVQKLLSTPGGTMSGLAQYNNDKPHERQLENFCAAMTKPGVDVLDTYANLLLKELVKPPAQCLDYTYANEIASYKEDGIIPEPSSGRGWLWMTCQEFGYFQTTDSNLTHIFGHSDSIKMHIQTCVDVFGEGAFSNKDSVPWTQHTNAYYGGRDKYAGTNVVIVNGGVDPWHMLGITQVSERNTNSKAIMIEGGSHCIEMFPVKPTEPKVSIPGKEKAQKDIREYLDLWLNKLP